MYIDNLTADGETYLAEIPESLRKSDQKTPLLHAMETRDEDKTVEHFETDRNELLPHQAGFRNYDDSDECTAITDLVLIAFCPVFTYTVVPFLIIVTAGILGLYLFWKPELRAKMLYQKVVNVDDATHVLVSGLDGNVEICKVHSGFDE
jgi:hypothetical protein